MEKIKDSSFGRLLGIWKTTGQLFKEDKAVDLSGTDTYELILDGNYILHKADVMMGDEKSETFELISLADTAETGRMQYFNSKGESGTMTSEMIGNGFFINGDELKFSGTINDQNSEMVGKWFYKPMIKPGSNLLI